MHGGLGRCTWAAACLIVALALWAPCVAAGSFSGEITRAQVTADWANASLAGFAEGSVHCAHGKGGVGGKEPPEGPGLFPWGPPVLPDSPPWACGWIPLATLGPGASQADCSASNRRWGSIGDGVQLVWSGYERGGGLAPFDLGDVALTHGNQAPLLCLSVIAAEEGFVCQAVGCPEYVIGHATHLLDSALLEVASTPVAQEQAQSSPPLSGEQPCGKPRKRQKRAKKHGGLALGPAIRIAAKPRPVGRCKTG